MQVIEKKNVSLNVMFSKYVNNPLNDMGITKLIKTLHQEE